MKKSLKFSVMLLSAILFVGCAPTPSQTSNNNSSNTTSSSTPTQTTDNKTDVQQSVGTSVTFTSKENGIENPVGPENISSIVVNGVTIPASDIKFSSSFTTKADTNSNYDVTYEGAGKYTIVNKNTGRTLENRALIIFNLLNSKTPAILPILSGILEQNIRMSIDLSTGTIFGGITKEDGSIDDTKPVFKIGTDGVLTITTPDGKQEAFKRNDANATNLPDPDKTVDITKEEASKQIEDIKKDVAPNSPIAQYVGLWLYSGLGQKIIMQVKDAGNNKFEATATVADKKYNGQGDYNPNGKNDTLTLKVAEDQMHIDFSSVGANSLQLTLKSTSNDALKTFVNAPLNLQRVRVTD